MKIDRLVSIIMILLDKERISAQELATMFEVSPRTIYRDIDAINLAGIPILATTGVGGGFEIMPQYKVDNKVFSTSDLSLILMGLSNLSNMIRGDELTNALVKIKSFIPAEQAKEIELQANQIYIDLNPWVSNKNTIITLEIVKQALQEHRLLAFTYTDRYGNKSERLAEPYQLVLKDNHWYWQAFCLVRNDFRLFRLSRTTNMQIQKTNFQLRDYPKPQLDFTEAFENLQIKIKLRFHQSIIEKILDYCAIEDLVADGSEHYLVEFPFIENDYYYDILLGFGTNCECLAPQRVRAEMKRRATELTLIYEK